LRDLSPKQLDRLLQRAIEFKRMHRRGMIFEPLKNRVLGMVFEKSSTRTRVSFETAMAQLGGHAIFLAPEDTQLGRGEPMEDTARVLSRLVDVIMIRTFEHDKIIKFANYSKVPVINGLTDKHHPCQLLADMQTYYEHCGPIKDKTVAWIGDGNNMCNSYIEAADLYGFHLHIACPKGYLPASDVLEGAAHSVEVFEDPEAAAQGADLIVTDVWASMGQERETAMRRAAFMSYQVDERIMALAKPEALFMHCLPAHRGEEVSHAVIDGPQSVVWDEAENRLFSQKALLEILLA
jgi:ornithine carbamoyltransferase